jgi:hypothetical protein
MPRISFGTAANGSPSLEYGRACPRFSFDCYGCYLPVFGSHRGGLSHFLDNNREVMIDIPEPCPGPMGVRRVIRVMESMEICAGAFYTGGLRGIEQSLAAKTEEGIPVIAGCSHLI